MQHVLDCYSRNEKGKCIGWQIRYTDRRTGEKFWYMNVLFPSAKSADDELKLLKKSKKQRQSRGVFLNREAYRGCFKIIKNTRSHRWGKVKIKQ